MSEMQKLKVGQVGVGGFGGYRRRSLRETGLFDLVAVSDYNPETLAQAAAEEGAQAVASYEELLAVPDLEAIIISTGAKFHADQVIQAAERGLHVFVEKPLCSTPEEMRTLLQVEKETGVVIGVGHNDHSADGASMTIKQKLDSGELGKLACFETNTAHNGGMLMKPTDWRADPEKNPGGMLFQCGVHSLHELMFFFGPVTEVSAMMRYDVHTSATADVALCHLKFASGLVGTLNAYHVTPYRHVLAIYGTAANLYKECFFFDEGTKLWQQTTHFDGKQEPHVPVEILPAVCDHGNLRSFFSAIREGTPMYPSLQDGARTVAVVFAAQASAQQGCCAMPVEVV
ncbi:MAG TPA: Gfo/Idh/MocA family oxidoreductase [Armatimonadota bacterium]|jgi:predicted dehydrogenase